MIDIFYRKTKYMNVKDTMIAQGCKGKKRDSQDDFHLDEKRKSSQTNKKREDRRSRSFVRQTTSFTSLNAPLEQVLLQVRDDSTLKWLDKLKSDPNKCPRNKYCRFHQHHRHNTFDCYGFKKQIEAFIKQGSYSDSIGKKWSFGTPLEV